ncbi:Carbohydrate esterase 4 protein [Mortierella sp. AD032]|nr:Carbohydrate esterase 4 protein [Mortierella sp. AD032]
MSLEKKKGMQTKNKVLISIITFLVIAGVGVGVYFGIRNNNNANGSSGNATGGNTPTAAPTAATTAPARPSGVPTPPTPPLHNGTMVNGTLLPYYTLTGPKPAPVTVSGRVYTNCVVPGTYSISYDDGPSAYTNQLLDILDREQVKVTFFVNGNNNGCIYDPLVRAAIRRAYNSGHQIASHTWSHVELTKQTPEQITTQMRRVEQALLDLIGVVPRYMRPPYGDGTFGAGNANDVKVQTTLGGLGYVITTWDIATGDADIDDMAPPFKLSDAELARLEQGNVTNVVNLAPKAPHMQLMHDTYQRTVTQLTPWSITYIKGLNYKLVTVAECLGDTDPRNWYQSFQAPAANPPTTCTP